MDPLDPPGFLQSSAIQAWLNVGSANRDSLPALGSTSPCERVSALEGFDFATPKHMPYTRYCGRSSGYGKEMSQKCSSPSGGKIEE